VTATGSPTVLEPGGLNLGVILGGALLVVGIGLYALYRRGAFEGLRSRE